MVFCGGRFFKPEDRDKVFIWKIHKITIYYYESSTNKNFDNYVEVYSHSDPAAKDPATVDQIHFLIKVLFKAKKIALEE